MANIVPLRKEVAHEHTWNVESVFPSDDAWEVEFKRVNEQLPSLVRFRGRLGESAAMLADWFEVTEQLGIALGKVVLYANMYHTVDTTDQAAAAKNDRARGLMARAAAAMSFAEPEMLTIGFDKLRAWTSQEPRLAIYGHYFDRLERRAAHVRSAEVEELLSELGDSFRTAAAIHGTLADADLRFTLAHAPDDTQTFEVTQGTIGALRTHPDREIRRTAWESYADAHLAVRNTMANCIAAGVKQNVFIARARRYESALDAALTGNYIPVAVFYNLVETFRRNLPTWHRYWAIRKRALGYDKMYVYDEKAPLTKTKPQVPFAQAVEWICNGMQPLGDEYVSMMRRGLVEERWVDLYPNKGKRAGAFSTGVPGTMPFILTSYNDDLFSMSTLAHELGHSMHKVYTQRTQPFVYSRYGIFLAEVASNFNQALVRAYLLNNPVIASPEGTKQSPSSQSGIASQKPLAMTETDFQIAVIEEAMSNFHRYFFIMPTLARFELEIHERVERGEALTAESMIALMADLFAEGYGDQVEIDRERAGITWAQFPTHLYSNFYVYQYTTGISGAHALAEGVLSGAPNAVDRYLAFLSAGGSMYPLDTLKRAGVDLTTPEPIERTFGVMARMVDRLEQLVA